MKLRIGFVSNSSSASFVVYKKNVPEAVLDAIRDHLAFAIEHGFRNVSDIDLKYLHPTDWTIIETDTELRGETTMDNFEMNRFLDELWEYFELPRFQYERDE
jgi:hypothetical protein